MSEEIVGLSWVWVQPLIFFLMSTLQCGNGVGGQTPNIKCGKGGIQTYPDHPFFVPSLWRDPPDIAPLLVHSATSAKTQKLTGTTNLGTGGLGMHVEHIYACPRLAAVLTFADIVVVPAFSFAKLGASYFRCRENSHSEAPKPWNCSRKWTVAPRPCQRGQLPQNHKGEP